MKTRVLSCLSFLLVRASFVRRYAALALVLGAMGAMAIIARGAPVPDEVVAKLEAAFGGQPVAAGAPPTCLTGLICELQQVLPELTLEQQQHLATLSPELARIVARAGIAPSRSHAPGTRDLDTRDLPSFPLEQTLIGKHCIVHYTFTHNPDISPSEAYANQVGVDIDRAFQILTPRYGKAVPSGPDKKLHVYIRSLAGGSGPDADAITVPDTPLPGVSSGYTVYMEISNSLMTAYGAHWMTELQGVCFHEYMHGIQLMHNGFSSTWFKEGQASWIAGSLVPDDTHLQSFLAASDSVVNQPNHALWETGSTTYRPYSTAIFMFYLAHAKGVGIMDRWLKQNELTNDATEALIAALGRNGGDAFTKLYRGYLENLYLKKIHGIDPAIIPSVPVSSTLQNLPTSFSVSVPPTGAVFFPLQHDDTLDNNYLVADLAAANSGTPEAILDLNPGEKSRKIIIAAAGEHTPVTGFRTGDSGVVIVTDATATTEAAGAANITGHLLSPKITLTAMDSPPIWHSDKQVAIKITYNLAGTPQGVSTFPLNAELLVTELTPRRHPPFKSSVDFDGTPGIGQTATINLSVRSDRELADEKFLVELILSTPTRDYYGHAPGSAVSKDNKSAPFVLTTKP